ncbi:MAG: ECF-type sigma factor [Planctomycetota bacterium]|nr:ECF-type sigma factor [Planctomycetota bacterium]
MAERDITGMLGEAGPENPAARDALLEAVYEKLREAAEARLRQERAGHTLQPTALVHEAYLKLVDQTRVNWQGRTHFLAVAALAMRRILIDHARRRGREKHGGGWRRVTLHDAFALRRDHELDVLALHEAMQRMAELDERQAKVVELRIFGGLTAEETARMLDVSTRTVERDWKMGEAWLRRELSERDG